MLHSLERLLEKYSIAEDVNEALFEDENTNGGDLIGKILQAKVFVDKKMRESISNSGGDQLRPVFDACVWYSASMMSYIRILRPTASCCDESFLVENMHHLERALEVMRVKKNGKPHPSAKSCLSSSRAAFSGDLVSDFFLNDFAEDDVPEVKTSYLHRELESCERDRLFSRLLREYGPVSNNISAYNNWIDVILEVQLSGKTCFNEANGFVFSFCNARVLKPATPDGRALYPIRARKCCMSYMGCIVADVRRRRRATTVNQLGESDVKNEEDVIVARNQIIWKIPVMLGSKACHLYRYSGEELRMVGEDAKDPFGYFIIRGMEKVVSNLENLAYSQQLSTAYPPSSASDSFGCETRVTTQHSNGTTVVSAVVGKRWPSIKVAVYQRGMKSATANRPFFPIFAVFDILFQYLDPKRFGYETVCVDASLGLLHSPTPSLLHLAVSDDTKRRRICEEAERLILEFIPPEHHERVRFFLAASAARYAMQKAPIAMALFRQQNNKGAARETLVAIARRREVAFLSSTSTFYSVVSSFSEANSASSSSPDSSKLLDENARLMIRDIFRDLFTLVPMRDKPVVLARLVAQQCLLSMKIIEPSDRDAWENKRIKLPAETLFQMFNVFFKFSIRNKLLYIDTLFSDQFVNSLTSSAGASASLMPPNRHHGGGTTTMPSSAVSGSAAAHRKRENTIQAVARVTNTSLISQITQVSTPANKQSRLMAIRHVHASQLGYICPAETPSGEACGLTKTVCCVTWVSLRREPAAYHRDILSPLVANGLISRSRSSSKKNGIFIDTILYGWCDAALALSVIRKRTKTSQHFFDATVILTDPLHGSCIEIILSGGRPCRPLFTVDEARGKMVIDVLEKKSDKSVYELEKKSDKSVYDWPIEDLIQIGAIEFVSTSEQQFIRVVQYPEDVPYECSIRRNLNPTPPPMYAEIDPISILGTAAGLMPVPETVQGPRVNYQASMVKQSTSSFHDVFYERWDGTFKRMCGMRPTFETRISRPVGFDMAPAGRMLIVAFMSLANNGEDGIVVKRESIIGTSMQKYTTHKLVVKTGLSRGARSQKTLASSTSLLCGDDTAAIGEDEPAVDASIVDKNAVDVYDILCRPPNEASEEFAGTHKHAAYRAIGDDGLPRLGDNISRGEYIIGCVRHFRRVVNSNNASGGGSHATVTTTIENRSVLAGIGDEGIVDRIDVSPGDNAVIVRVRIVKSRAIFPGDKLAARFAQKGTISSLRSNVCALVGSQKIEVAPPTHVHFSASSREASMSTYRAAMKKSCEDDLETQEEGVAFKYAKELPSVSSGPNRGLVPDIFINTHSMPSRMTIGMLYEMMAGTVALHTGERVDGTAFRSLISRRRTCEEEGCDKQAEFAPHDLSSTSPLGVVVCQRCAEHKTPGDVVVVDKISKFENTLSEAGVNKWSEETFEHPDGTPFMDGTRVFVAPCFYQFLRHNVLDKIQFRNTGEVKQTTQQPIGGRCNNGGLRLGEMEKDCMCSWGAADLVRERLMLASDPTKIEVCTSCGTQTLINAASLLEEEEKGADARHNVVSACKKCPPSSQNIGVVETSYTHLLIKRMVEGLGITVKFGDLSRDHRGPDM
jgi:DNA-directed RNA polymerase beta subunit